MKATSKLLTIIAAAGIFAAGCANEIILRRGDKFGNYEISTIHNGVLDDKEYFTFELKKDYKIYPVEINEDGIGKTFIQGTNYAVRVYKSSNPEKIRVGLMPISEKKE